MVQTAQPMQTHCGILSMGTDGLQEELCVEAESKSNRCTTWWRLKRGVTLMARALDICRRPKILVLVLLKEDAYDWCSSFWHQAITPALPSPIPGSRMSRTFICTGGGSGKEIITTPTE